MEAKLIMLTLAAGTLGLGALGDVDPSTLQTAQRFAWQQGHQATQEIQILPPGLGSVAVNAVTPGGANVVIQNQRVFLTWTPTELGLHEIPIQVTASSPPPFTDWTGQLLVRTQTVKVQVWVYPSGDADFTVTGPDTLIGP